MTTEEFDLFLSKGFLVKEQIPSVSEYHAEEYDEDTGEFSGELDHTYLNINDDEDAQTFTIESQADGVIMKGISKDELVAYVKKTLANT